MDFEDKQSKDNPFNQLFGKVFKNKVSEMTEEELVKKFMNAIRTVGMPPMPIAQQDRNETVFDIEGMSYRDIKKIVQFVRQIRELFMSEACDCLYDGHYGCNKNCTQYIAARA